MKNSELLGVVLSIIGMIILMIDLKGNNLNWTILSAIGLLCVIPGIVLMFKSMRYEYRSKT